MNKLMFGLSFITLSALSIAATGCAAESTEVNADEEGSESELGVKVCADAKTIASCKALPRCSATFKSNMPPGSGSGVPAGTFGPPRLDKCVDVCSVYKDELSCSSDPGCIAIRMPKCANSVRFCPGLPVFNSCISAGCTGLSKAACKANPACKEVIGVASGCTEKTAQ